jgi:hypothetical protein
MFFVMGAFVLYFIKGLVIFLSLFTEVVDLELEPALLLIDLFVLITLYIMIIKK